MQQKALTQEELHQYRNQLLFMRSRLRSDVTEMADKALNKSLLESSGNLSATPLHMADIGTDNFDQEFTLSLVESGSGTLTQIEAALERIDEGTYGVCEECECRIPKVRLNAIPYAYLCVKCASETEKQY